MSNRNIISVSLKDFDLRCGFATQIRSAFCELREAPLVKRTVVLRVRFKGTCVA